MKTKLLIIGDILLLYSALGLGLFLRYYPKPIDPPLSQHWFPFSVIFFFWLVLLGAFGLYDLRFIKNSRRFLVRLLQAAAVNVVIAIFILYFIPYFDIEPRRNLLIITTVATFLLFIWRYLFNLFIARTPATRLIFFGITPETIELADYLLKNPQLGYKPAAFLQREGVEDSLLPLPHFIFDEQTFAHIIRDHQIDMVVIAPEMKADQTLVHALFQVIPLGVIIAEFPALHEMVTGKIPLSLINETWFLENLIGQRKPRYEFAKRIFDFSLALFFGAFLLFCLPFIMAGVILTRPSDLWRYKERRARQGDGIIFFRQKRVGKSGVWFDFVKIRSQLLGAEKMSEAKAAENDARHYALGKLMRIMYLDELAQAWNVLRGEMSFVGPRPERPEYVLQLKQKVPFYEMRLIVRPGITGWAQVNMENDASVEDAPEKMQYDLYYIKNRSLTLDLLILMRTIFAVVGRTGR
ncbi:MAG: sugar transferase [Candidatus Sungbacteria bacterium]|uniref:Sugar transferase n=1 Tax=Candidatus Sungiibacteriota bacterium TaxID=2750080 RepID=A0A931SCY5_9BACT|nr:sugar transferase [Candidatus Sungbacteria bacterium]